MMAAKQGQLSPPSSNIAALGLPLRRGARMMAAE